MEDEPLDARHSLVDEVVDVVRAVVDEAEERISAQSRHGRAVLLHRIDLLEERILSSTNDLTAALAELSNQVTATVNDVQTALSNLAAELAAAGQTDWSGQITAIHASLNALKGLDTAAVAAAAPPAAPPAP